jgi:hypothetical protein
MLLHAKLVCQGSNEHAFVQIRIFAPYEMALSH